MLRSVALLPVLATVLACGDEPSPEIVGRVESGVSAADALAIEVNGDVRRVDLEGDGYFTIDSLPTGELVLTIATEDVTGELQIHDVEPGERIEISVKAGDGRLDLRVIRREIPAYDDDGDSDGDSDSDSDGRRDGDPEFTVRFEGN